ncbi:RNA polymerase sigma factor [Bacteroides sp. 519]|uniref:RNA polymerase sigma factor n=1 Tax=Bacteroides sp. 519 TaxID=2302937 RepID=UPI0013D0EB1B|nr:RNA polymerase sigma factor [Bacteroides sp. 519]NDV59523.1 RNA polymerase sigma factor [Bacteroides sp. 519]
MNSKEEKLYIKRILDGETELYACFLESYSRSIYSLVIQIVSSAEDAEEIVQDVFLKAFKSLYTYRGDSSFSTWLYRIAYNMAIGFTRKKKHDFLAIEESIINNVPDDKADSVLFPSEDEEKIMELTAAIEKLTPEEKAIITLFYYEEKSIDETAEITKLSVANVKVRLHRIRKKLYVLLKGDDDGK